jgi:hypothetical protein
LGWIGYVTFNREHGISAFQACGRRLKFGTIDIEKCYAISTGEERTRNRQANAAVRAGITATFIS